RQSRQSRGDPTLASPHAVRRAASAALVFSSVTIFARLPHQMITNRSNPAIPPDDTRLGFIARLRARINKGDSWLTYDLANLVPGRAIDAQVLEELETRLLTADVGVEATDRILDDLKG